MLIINNSTGYNYIAIISNTKEYSLVIPVIIATIDISNCFKIKKVSWLAAGKEVRVRHKQRMTPVNGPEGQGL